MTITTRFHPPDGPDGSGGVLGTGAGICFNGLMSDLYFPLGHYTSVFQAEVHAIMQCALAPKRLDSSDEHICTCICSDSQAVLMALCNPRVVSKQIWECIGALNKLASHRPVSLTWVPAHSGIPGNEQADHLAKTASCQPYMDQNLHFLCLIILLRQL